MSKSRLGRLQRTLLSMLLAHANQPVSADALCEMLWGDRVDDRVSARLQLLVHRLRASLGSAELITYGPLGYTLVVTEGQLDADRFGELAEMLSADEGMDVVARAREALGLWRGLPFADLDSPALEMRRASWVERRLAIFGRLFEAELEAGNHGDILAEIDDLARQNPLNERLQALLMVALFRNGRQGDALDVYRVTREHLVEELGIEPGEELRRTHANLLSGQAELGRVAAAPVPAHLPPAMPALSGRDADLVELDKLVAQEEESSGLGSPVCVVTGTAGVGKTAFATHWAQQHREDFPDGQLFCDLRGFSSDEPVEATEVLAAFIRGLGGDTSSLAPGLDERMAMFRSLMAGRRVLILLDNARTAEQVRPLLPGTSGCLVLITSRESLSGLAVRDGAQSIDLDRLELEDALVLLARHAGDWVRDDLEAAHLLIECCARLPLALRIVAEQLRMRPGRDILMLARELAAQRPHLDTFDTGDEPTDVRLVFSWSYESLPDSAQRLFRLMGLLPGRDVSLEGIASFADLAVRDVRRDLDHLVRAHLVDEDLARCFGQHDLLRAYAGEVAESVDSPEEWSSARSRLLDYYCFVAAGAAELIAVEGQNRLPEVEPTQSAYPEITDHDAAMAWLDAERSNIVAAVRTAGVEDGLRVVTLSQLLNYYFRDRGQDDDARLIHGLALRAARDLEHLEGEAQAESALGMIDGNHGDFESSEQHFVRALAIYRRLHHRVGISAALNNIGKIASMKGDKLTSIAMITEGLELNRQDGDDARVALKLANIGEALLDLGRHDEAFEKLEEALELSRAGGFRFSLGYVLGTLADAHSANGAFEAALLCADESLAVSRSLHSRVLEGEALLVRGHVDLRRGDRDGSLEHYEAALKIGREAGQCDLTAEALEGLADLHSTGEPDLTASYLEEAVEVASKYGLHGREERLREKVAALVTP